MPKRGALLLAQNPLLTPAFLSTQDKLVKDTQSKVDDWARDNGAKRIIGPRAPVCAV